MVDITQIDPSNLQLPTIDSVSKIDGEKLKSNTFLSIIAITAIISSIGFSMLLIHQYHSNME